MSNIVLKFQVYEMETMEISWFVLCKPEKCPVYEMETGNFTVYVT